MYLTLWSHSDGPTLWSLLVLTVGSPDCEAIHFIHPQPIALVLVASTVHGTSTGVSLWNDLVTINALPTIKLDSPVENHINHSLTS